MWLPSLAQPSSLESQMFPLRFFQFKRSVDAETLNQASATEHQSEITRQEYGSSSMPIFKCHPIPTNEGDPTVTPVSRHLLEATSLRCRMQGHVAGSSVMSHRQTNHRESRVSGAFVNDMVLGTL
jgi:hypothetical protein